MPVTEQEMPEYYRIVRELTTTRRACRCPSSTSPPTCSPTPSPPAATPSTPPSPSPRASSQILDWDELRGVLAHEISHVGNRDILIGSVAAAVAIGITFIARMARCRPPSSAAGRDDDGDNPIALLALAILAPLAAGLLQMALSRSREFEADRTGARLIGDGEPLARALAQARGRRQADPDEHRPGPRPGVHRQPADRPQGAVRQPVPHPPARPRTGSPASARGSGPASPVADRRQSSRGW